MKKKHADSESAIFKVRVASASHRVSLEAALQSAVG